MIYQLKGLNLYKGTTLLKSKLETESRSLYTLGHFIGAIHDEEILDQDSVINYLNDGFSSKNFSDTLSSFMPNVVGSCIFVLIEKDLQTTFFSSFSSHGLFFSTINNEIKFTTNEEFIGQLVDDKNIEIDEEELLSNMTLHSIFCRAPFKTFLKSVFRVPAGAFTQINIKENYKITNGILFKQIETQLSKRDEVFKNLLNGILELQVKYYKDRLYLFFSGGIDSSLLLANLKELKTNIIAMFIPYHGIRSRAAYTAKFLAKIFKTKLIITNMGITDDNFIRLSAQSGFGTLPGMQYLGAGNRLDHLGLGNEAINVLSGQNADTLLHIDTFAPASTVIGYKRLTANITARNKRYVYSNSNLKEINTFDKFNNILKHIASSLDEHEDYDLNNKFNQSDINSIIRSHKVNNSYLPVLNILNNQLSIEDNFDSIDSGSKIYALKVMRWFRTVQNVPVNYLNLSKVSKINRIIPYTEGPMANFAVNYEILPMDHFFEKRIIYKLFFRLSKIHYRFLINVAFIVNLPKLIYDKVQFLIFKKESLEQTYKNNIGSLQQLTINYENVHKRFKNKEILRYLAELQKLINGDDIALVKLTKQDELVRYAGAIYFLNKMLKKTN